MSSNLITDLIPEMQPVALQLLSNAKDAGLELTVEDTLRTPTEQVAAIAAGRSWTNYSLHLPQPPTGKSKAIDVVPKVLVVLKQWGWFGTIGTSDPRWLQLGEIGEKLGLEWGGRWSVDPPHSRPDPGHFQWVEATLMDADLSVG